MSESVQKTPKKKLKLYKDPGLNENDPKEPLFDLSPLVLETATYLVIYAILLVFTFFSLALYIVKSVLYWVLFSLMTICEWLESLKKKVTARGKNKGKTALRPIRRNSSNENFRKMKRLEKGEEFIGEKPFNVFLEIRNVLFVFVERKTDSDVKEIIIHPQGKKQIVHYIKTRPFVNDFLEQASFRFNIIVYTSLEKDLADKIIETMGLNDYFPKRYYRDACFNNKMSKKDPSKDLSGILSNSLASLNRTIFIDHSAKATMDIKHLTLLIKPWNGNPSDKELSYCLDALESFADDPENKHHIIESFNS